MEPTNKMSDISDTALRQRAWDAAIHLFGTAEIFQRRARRLNASLTLLKAMGLILPLSVGGFVTTFGTSHLDRVLWVVGPLSLIQLIVSAFAIVYGRDDAYAYARESQRHNKRLSDQYKKLGETPPDHDELKRRLDLLDVEAASREEQDSAREPTAKEKRFGMRQALYQFQRTCTVCEKVPNPRVPSNCVNCGK